MTTSAPEPDDAAFDDFDGDDIHEKYIGEEVAPDEDPNITEHHDG